MLYEAYIVTPWTGDGTDDNPNRPQLGDEHVFSKWEDHTGQNALGLRPDPNLYILRVELEEAALTGVEADGTYYVVSSEEMVEDEPGGEEAVPTVGAEEYLLTHNFFGESGEET
jgi:hypothetical protein